MISLKKALNALSRGSSTLEQVVATLESTQVVSFEDARSLLDDIDFGLSEQLIDAETGTVLQATVRRITASQLGSPTSPTAAGTTRAIPHIATADRTQAAFSTGVTLRGRFLIMEELGSGGMGKVYKALDLLKEEARDRNPYIALKVLNEDIKQRPIAMLALQREASRQQRLAHPNIATVHDFDRIGELAFITMEFLEGTRLDNFIKQHTTRDRGVPLSTALPLIRDMAKALGYAHAHGIIHCDFKPSNCFVTSSNSIKVLDFGIARAVRKPEIELTLLDGASLGAFTPAYASFEMLEQEGDPDPSDDVYALACVSYELLSGSHPFGRVPANAAEKSGIRLKPISQLNRSQNRALAQALRFRRADRTDTVEAFVDQLQGKAVTDRARATGAIAAVCIAAASYIGHRMYEDTRSESIISELLSKDPSVLASGVRSFIELRPADRQTILLSSGEKVIDRMVDDIKQLSDARRFVDVEERVRQARALFKDSARIEDAARTALIQRSKYLAQLAETFESALLAGRLLTTDPEPNIPSILEELREFDSGNRLLTDIRLESAYARESSLALAKQDAERAERLVNAGRELLPNSSAIRSAYDQYSSYARRRELARQIADAAAELTTVIEKRASASTAPLIAESVRRLRELSPQHATIEALTSQYRKAFEVAFEKLAADPTLPGVEALEQEYSALFSVLYLDKEKQRLVQLQDQLRTGIDAVRSMLRGTFSASSSTSVDMDEVAEAFKGLRRLTGSADSTFEQELIDTYADKARIFLRDGNVAQADTILASLQVLESKNLSVPNLAALAQDIDSARKASSEAARKTAESTRLAKARARQVELYKEIRSATADMHGADDAESIAQLIASLESLGTPATELALLRNALAEKLVSKSFENARASGDWSFARSELTRLKSLLGGNETLTRGIAEAAAVEQEEQRRKLDQQRLGLVTSIQRALDEIPSVPSQRWFQELRTSRDSLRRLVPEGQEITDRLFAPLGKRLVERADELHREERYEAAIELLGQGNEILKDPELTAAIQRIEASQRASVQRRNELEAAAKREADAQRFEALLNANELLLAAALYSQLTSNGVRNGDLMAGKGLTRLVSALSTAAVSALKNKQYSSAEELASAGMKLSLDNVTFTKVHHAARLNTAIEHSLRALETNGRRGFREAERALNDWQSEHKGNLVEDLSRFEDALIRIKPPVSAQELATFPILLGIFNSKNEVREASIEHGTAEANVATADATKSPEASRLAGAKPAHSEKRSIHGSWCQEGLKITLTDSEVVFTLDDGGRVAYEVLSYSDRPSGRVQVQWRDGKGQEISSEFEFVPGDPTGLIQVRGKSGDSTWIVYDRHLRACH